jgi:diguanylate cyclase (GGDEF)-like protein
MTGLPNRRAFDETFRRLYLLQKRNAKPVSLLFFDVDDFKQINDSLGHYAGDRALVRIAALLKESVRETDLSARWGGEEFIVALIDTGVDDAYVIAEKIRESIESDAVLRQIADHPVTASFGLTGSMEHDTIEAMLKRADDALYEAKAQGKNKIAVR